MGYQLTVTPDSFVPKDQKGFYKFYYQQVIELTIVVTSDSEAIQDGQLVYVYPVSMGLFGNSAETVLRAYGECTSVSIETVSVALVKTDDHTGVAKLQVLVTHSDNVQIDPQDVWVSLSLPVNITDTPALQFDRYEGVFFVPMLNSGFTLPVVSAGLSVEPGPAGSCNNYIRYQFEVTDEHGVGLQHMRVMLQADTTGSPLNSVLLYSAWESITPLPMAEVQQGTGDWYADVLTDEHGYAEVYLCGKAGTKAMNWLSAQATKINLDVAPFVITDFAPQDSLVAPSVESLVPLDREVTVPVSINQLFDAGQQIYWYCNGKYQNFSEVGDDRKVPTFYLNSFGLYSEDYDNGAQLNTLLYIAPRVTYLGASPSKSFAATGMPPVAKQQLYSTWPVPTLPAPFIADHPNGWPINISMVRERLRLHIPLAGTSIRTGDVLRFNIYLNGFRLPSDDGEPVGGSISGPLGFKVTHRMQDLGYAEWLVPPLPMLGYGQMGHQNLNLAQKIAAQVGDIGTLEVSYQVYRGSRNQNWALLDVQNPAPDLCSEALRLGLDTIGPDGSVPAVA